MWVVAPSMVVPSKPLLWSAHLVVLLLFELHLLSQMMSLATCGGWWDFFTPHCSGLTMSHSSFTLLAVRPLSWVVVSQPQMAFQWSSIIHAHPYWFPGQRKCTRRLLKCGIYHTPTGRLSLFLELDVESYRPLSMFNLDYKILSKILAARLQPHLPTLVHDYQNRFIPSAAPHKM